jgi:DNA-binding beta-propeller fold protein YncE
MKAKTGTLALRGAGAALLVTTALHAQGEFVNFEEPQVKPITVATLELGGVPKSFALVCNTPDNSVEVYEGAAPFVFVARVPVGLSPVSVRWNPLAQRFYTCNFLGDSVTAVRLDDAAGVLVPVVERTVRVGDEPTDIAFPFPGEAWVALHSRSRIARVQASDLATLGETVLQKPDPFQPKLITAVKAPRALATLADGRFFALNTQGGHTGSGYDLDLYVEDPHNPPAGSTKHVHLVGQMGTTNTAFALDGLNRRMFVVGGSAQNGGVGVVAVSTEPLGFVQSRLWVVDTQPNGNLDGAPPAVVPEATPSATPNFSLFQSIDLNREYVTGNSAPIPVPLAERVSQPTDVLLVESQPGVVAFVVVACFGSDKVLVLSPDATQNGGYRRAHVDLGVNDPSSGYGAVGPRGLALDPLTGLVWVENRLDHSLAIFSPATPTIVARRNLRQDPTPVPIREGRPFLYSAPLTSGSGMVACASCHVDGRTDGQQWNLGSIGSPLEPIPDKLLDNDDPTFPIEFETAKGVMITQTLQGLVNSNIEDLATQYVTSNAPYHWRGDKPGFQDFNEAFHNLQGMPDLNAGTGLPPAGLSAQQMDQYTTFINTIHYPPNPEQPRTRVYGGSLGANPDDLEQGSGALYGMKLYHIAPSMGPRACVHCHTLPEGSSNTFVLDFGTTGGLLPVSRQNPRENAAVRGLFQREQALIDSFDQTRPSDWTRVAEFGLTHDGIRVIPGAKDQRSINDFDAGFELGDSAAITALMRLRRLNMFLRQFDWGVAPIIGWTMTVDSTHPIDAAMLADMRAAVEEANAGLAVHFRTSGAPQGYYYDVTSSPAVYRRVGGLNALSEAQLLALVQTPDDRLIFQSTPAGSERRVAHVTGNPNVLPGPGPTDVELLPMVPSTSFVDVTRFTAFLDPFPNSPGDFKSIKAMRALEDAARADGIVGVAAQPRHEPPRRFRVAGNDIRIGAKLGLGMDVGTSGSGTTKWLWLDLAPTKYRHVSPAGELVVWETTEELDPKMTMEFLNGGPELNVVRQVSDGDLSVAGQLDPSSWNGFLVDVLNQNGTSVLNPPRKPLSIGDAR